ncbi:extracellular matrix protein 2 isoform X1 [Astyanax mexicanus]|uniref:Extracellular matrix protein 2 isoform X1 n=2 Tax=Astyanax mexicanus TaxID=7994 RepID=A0A8T2KTM6_ASTMX|nr:extracellular matrix protein 2 isoform X1 [Astyanax mexicanus]
MKDKTPLSFILQTSVMRLWLLLAVSFFCCLSYSSAEHPDRPLAPGRRRRGKKMVRQGKLPKDSGDNGASLFIETYKGVQEPKPSYNVIAGNTGQCVFQGITMFDKTVWSPKPCVTCLCSGGDVVCDELQCPLLKCQLKFKPIRECCPICIDSVHEVSESSGDSPVPSDPSYGTIPHIHTQTEESLRREKQKEEEAHLRKKDAERKMRKKQKKEAERLRKQERAKEEKLRRLREEEEEKAAAEEKRRRMEEHLRVEEERMKRQEREMLRAFEEAAARAHRGLKEEERGEEEEEDEEMIWLRGDVFQMPSHRPTPESLPAPPTSQVEEEEEEGEDEEEDGETGERLDDEESLRITYLLPKGCTISDVIVSCENAKLTSIPALSIPELKSLNLQGNAITTIPGGAFNGVPNLEWIDLGKNKILSSGIDPQAFRNLKFLSRLYLDGNLLEVIPRGLPHTLQELKINENNLKEIEENSFKGLSSLVTLELEDNLLSEGNVNPEAFLTTKELTYLRMGRNLFRTIPQGLPPSLQELHLENNLIEEISEGAFNQTKNLNVVMLRHNRLDETRIAPLAWIDHKSLESVDLSYNKLHLVPSFLPKTLIHLGLVGNRIERIPGYVFAHMEPGLEYLYLSFNKLDADGVEPESFFGTLNSMTELCLDHNQLTGVPYGVNEMTSLHFLRLNNNNIRHIGEDSICDPLNDEDSHLVALRLENNLIDPRKIAPSAFSCVRSYSSVVLKPQRIK